MKKIFLMRHSIPEKGDMPNEQIPLSEEGKALAVSKRNIFSNVDRCFSSPYRRAMETAEFIADHPVIVKELHERTIGDAREDFWLKQYEDHDFRNPGGESLNQVKVRMKTAIDSIVGQMEEGETALVVSHATAICAYLLSYCEIEVKDAENKVRKISFHGKKILNGRFQPADGFEILFENDIFSDRFREERVLSALAEGKPVYLYTPGLPEAPKNRMLSGSLASAQRELKNWGVLFTDGGRKKLITAEEARALRAAGKLPSPGAVLTPLAKEIMEGKK